MNHYFTNDYTKKNEKTKEVIIKNTHLKFITDSGTFSKKGLDFGTRSLLENINIEEIKGDVLDFGCGWGPIGIYIKKKTKANVDMCDINIKSIDLAKRNAKINNVKVEVFESNSYQNIKNKYDYIITNPPIRVGKEKLYEILHSSIDHLKENGKMYFVINKNQGAKSIIKDMNEKAKTTLVKKNKGFYIIMSQKY